MKKQQYIEKCIHAKFSDNSSWGNHLVDAEILFYACQPVCEALFLDSDEET